MIFDDYAADVQFGEWLRKQREGIGFSISEISEMTGMAVKRIHSLEMGLSEKGITKKESLLLSQAYKIELYFLMDKATGVAKGAMS